MKRLVILVLLFVSSPVLAGYTYVVTDGVLSFGSLWDHESLLMTGGGGDSLTLYEWSSALITGTSPYNEFPTGGIRELRLADYSRLDFYGGDVFGLYTGAYSTISIYGGQFREIGSGQSAWKGDPQNPIPNPHIEIVCRNWSYDALSKQLTGAWGDFSAFNIKLIDVQGYSPTIDNIKFTIIPEPMTLVLIGLGSLFVRRWR